VAAAIGQPLNIPPVVRSLGQDMYQFGMVSDGIFRPGLELISYLDGNLSSNGLDDPALVIRDLDLAWWAEEHMPTGDSFYLSSTTLRSALDHYRQELEETLIDCVAPHFGPDFINHLNKPAYTWHSAVNDTLPNDLNYCTRCHLYRAVEVGLMDQVRDIYNMVHACEVANQAERDIGIRRASGFNELYEAAIKKECKSQAASGPGSGLESTHNQQSGSGSGSGKGKEKQQFGPEVEMLKESVMELVRSAGGASSKWTWGVELTNDDLRGLIRGADRQDQGSHTGYDSPLASGSLISETSTAFDPNKLEDPEKSQLWFDDVSSSIASISKLRPDQFPLYSDVNLMTGEELDPEPDLVIEAFSKKAKVKANKMVMQDEVDRPVSYRDYGSEFIPRIALIPKRPWLIPSLPIILPPTNKPPIIPTDQDNIGTELDADHIPISDFESDNIPGHIDISESDSVPDSMASSDVIIPISDGSNAMDVVRSDEHDIPSSESGSDIVIPGSPVESGASGADSGSDIVLPESPMASGASGALIGIERDHSTGRFTAASFANISDELFD